jgi:hypothetical protein
MHSEWSQARQQFRVLHRVFLLRVVNLELLPNGDPTRLIGQFLTTFASISILLILPALVYLFFGGGMRMTTTWMYEHFLIETSMTVALLIALFNWDAAFPDKRDILILGPSPVRTGTLFMAKFIAFLVAPGLGVIAMNIFVGIFWPIFFRSNNAGFLGTLRAWPAYWIAILLVSAFSVFTVLAFQGLASTLIPRQLFLRLSPFLQAAFVSLCVGLYFLEPSLESPEALTSPHNQRLLEFLPSYWFLAIFNQLNGSFHPAFAHLERRGWIGISVAAFGACAALLLSYVLKMRALVEQPDIVPSATSVSWEPKWVSPLTQVLIFFTLRTSLRSRRHRMMLGFYLGLGGSCAVGYANRFLGGFHSVDGTISVAFLLITIVIMILTIFSLRTVAAIPISPLANWIIRITQVRPARDYHKAIRISWVALGLAPASLVTAAILVLVYPWAPALGHFLLLLSLGFLLVELCLYTFQKIPFTCSYLSGKAQINFVFWACLMLIFRLMADGAEIESRMLRHLRSFIGLVLIVAIAASITRYLNESRASSTDELQFEDEDSSELTSLGLT